VLTSDTRWSPEYHSIGKRQGRQGRRYRCAGVPSATSLSQSAAVPLISQVMDTFWEGNNG
jgi:hypothetical protein